jgi:transposase
MIVIGIDAHKRSHTAVTVDEMGRQGFVKTVGTTTQDHLLVLKWAVGLAAERLWAIEDCRHLTRRLERDLIAAGESVVRVSPKLMAHARDSSRSYGKSDPIDARAVARDAEIPVFGSVRILNYGRFAVGLQPHLVAAGTGHGLAAMSALSPAR